MLAEAKPRVRELAHSAMQTDEAHLRSLLIADQSSRRWSAENGFMCGEKRPSRPLAGDSFDLLYCSFAGRLRRQASEGRRRT